VSIVKQYSTQSKQVTRWTHVLSLGAVTGLTGITGLFDGYSPIGPIRTIRRINFNRLAPFPPSEPHSATFWGIGAGLYPEGMGLGRLIHKSSSVLASEIW